LDGVRLAADSLQVALARGEAARAAFRIVSRKRDEGAATQVEFIDARTTLTNAELGLSWARYELLEQRAEYQFAAGIATDTGDAP
jgi:outer membrane protein TolC